MYKLCFLFDARYDDTYTSNYQHVPITTFFRLLREFRIMFGLILLFMFSATN